MPGTEYQGTSSPFASIGRSILSIRRDQIHSVDVHHDSAAELELEAFQKHVAEIFHDLADSGDEVLSLPWIRKLLDSFLICLEEFRVILFNSKAVVSRAPLDRLISEFFDRGVKALDVCNAIRDGIDQIRQWQKHLEIVLLALNSSHLVLGEGQIRRARKALADLAVLMLDEKDGIGGGVSILAQRNRSFGRNSHGKDNHHGRAGTSHFRSQSWSVSRTWSAAKQLQAMNSNLNVPRGNEISATNGLAIPVFTMNNVLMFVMWTLVASIPCQDRGLQIHFSIPRSFIWALPILSLHERIMDESKKKDRKNSCGMLKEIHQIEKSTRNLADLIDLVQFPLPEEKDSEVKHGIQELAQVCEVLKEELDPLERQVREVFHRILRSRTEGLDPLGKTHNSE
ncbi:hypothetical protein HPP92_013287 [Vanilla planifolia]|uniref:Uncharacterized protein n=1 Tax=Vanilla planifolia TaxID=51239 RepID=A0A835UYN1_VANPL|nr:hypothetical protein HPP92_013765 [Vanilla planifolia]KAG0478568.1 hypothetical protein HPP92_013287 [Vanilla planifolia]